MDHQVAERMKLSRQKLESVSRQNKHCRDGTMEDMVLSGSEHRAVAVVNEVTSSQNRDKAGRPLHLH